MADLDPRTDQELVEAANRGDGAAFDALYRRYRDWVVSLAWRFTGNREDALDVLQETFTYLLRKFPSGGASAQVPGFRLTAGMKTFLYTAVRNRSIDLRRRRVRNTPGDDPLAELPAPPSPSADAQRSDLADALAGLSEPHREILLMRFADDMTLAEIASALDIPLGTVKSRLHSAIEAIRSSPRTRDYFQ